MELCALKFEEKEIDGKYCLQPVDKITDVNKFQEVLKVVKAHGGLYSRTNGFMFETKPNFDEKLAPKVVEPVQKVVPAKVVEEKKAVKELDKPENKVPEKEIPKGVEFEVYTPISLDECGEYIKSLLEKKEFQAPDHQTLLKMILVKCKDNEQLRANLKHKDYSKMLTQGAAEWAKRNKKSGNVCCTPDDICDDVIEKYKEAVVKKTKGPKKEKKKK